MPATTTISQSITTTTTATSPQATLTVNLNVAFSRAAFTATVAQAYVTAFAAVLGLSESRITATYLGTARRLLTGGTVQMAVSYPTPEQSQTAAALVTDQSIAQNLQAASAPAATLAAVTIVVAGAIWVPPTSTPTPVTTPQPTDSATGTSLVVIIACSVAGGVAVIAGVATALACYLLPPKPKLGVQGFDPTNVRVTLHYA